MDEFAFPEEHDVFLMLDSFLLQGNNETSDPRN
jgi:hypothetical protein